MLGSEGAKPERGSLFSRDCGLGWGSSIPAPRPAAWLLGGGGPAGMLLSHAAAGGGLWQVVLLEGP